MELYLEHGTLDLVNRVQKWYKDFDISDLHKHAVMDSQNQLCTQELLMVLLILY